jgi:hypothetical protein
MSRNCMHARMLTPLNPLARHAHAENRTRKKSMGTNVYAAALPALSAVARPKILVFFGPRLHM